MTKDERDDLLEDANQLAYTAIKFSGLYKELSSAEWDKLADQMGQEIVGWLNWRCEQEAAFREAAKESTSA